MKSFILAVLLAACVGFVSATCPNLCNGHGTCGENDRCTCFNNWQGADCSERVCAYGLAWVDGVSADNTAHAYAECSNKGLCDRETGLCDCFEGYEGKGCRRSTCPNDCSGHGTCYYIKDLKKAASDRSNRKVEVDYGTGDLSNKKWYDNWDAYKIQGCVCDPGYEGADCSLRQCPRGDNRLTVTEVVNGQVQAKDQGATVQEIIIRQPDVAAGMIGEFVLTYTDLYGGKWTTEAIPLSGKATGQSAAAIAKATKAALEKLPNGVIDGVTVTGVPCGENADLSTTAASGCTGGGSNDDATAGQITAKQMCTTGTSKVIYNGRLGGGYAGYSSAHITALGAVLENAGGTVGQVAGDYGLMGQCVDLVVEFTGDQNSGVQELLEVGIAGCQEEGCAPYYRGVTDADVDGTAAKAIVVHVWDVTTLVPSGNSNKRMHKESAVCSEHGLCDSSSGLCQCFSGYYDEDCNKQTVLV